VPEGSENTGKNLKIRNLLMRCSQWSKRGSGKEAKQEGQHRVENIKPRHNTMAARC
jgi:hypothetical protein